MGCGVQSLAGFKGDVGGNVFGVFYNPRLPVDVLGTRLQDSVYRPSQVQVCA